MCFSDLKTMAQLLEVRNLSYTYPEDTHFKLKQIDFTLGEGKILAIVGESGSGKTTLLQLIAGLHDLDAGEVLLEGEKVTGPSYNLVPGHPAIKMVFQHFKLSPKINVYQNIAYLLKAYPPELRQERVQELLTICKLRGLEERMPHALSGGEKQRLAIARALADGPLLLLMDEPFSNMDIMLKNQLKEDILEILEDTGTTGIFVTHDMHDALSVADQIAVMQKGKLVQTGTPAVVYENPVHPYVAQLFGECNFLDNRQARCLLPEVPEGRQTLCIRAEHIQLARKEKATCCGSIVRKHFMGAYQQLTVKVEDSLLVLYAKNNNLRVGDQVCLAIDMDKLLYFKQT